GRLLHRVAQHGRDVRLGDRELVLADEDVVQRRPVVPLGQFTQRAIALLTHLLEDGGDAGAQLRRDRLLRALQHRCTPRGIERGPVEAIHCGRTHASILSTGTTSKPQAPARLRSSRCCQVIAPWHSVCSARVSAPSTCSTVGASASGSSLSRAGTAWRWAWNSSSLLSFNRNTPSSRRCSSCASA